jgi:glycopeptide antibiotics resistance protein
METCGWRLAFTLFGPIVRLRPSVWWWPLAMGLGGSVAIDVTQPGLSTLVGYPYRRTDIDDVILNTAEAFLGYALFIFLWKGLPGLYRRVAGTVPPTAPGPR